MPRTKPKSLHNSQQGDIGMYAFIKGVLAASSPISIVVETGGIGYKIFIPVHFFSQLPQLGEQLLVHTSFVVRELSQTLYGFISVEERDLFEILTTVSGIGPKLALCLIGHLPCYELQKAIKNQEIVLLCKIPGIGKKTAERLCMELRDKLVDLETDSNGPRPTATLGSTQAQKVSDAMSALINLGYNQATAQKAIKTTLKELDEDSDLATLITRALQKV
jgi:Holliday junction DNA helicase RuvA